MSAFPSPDWPEDERPWRPNRDLSEEAFKSEAREWDVNEIVFDRLWGAYHAILRADFELFDRYAYRREREGGDETPFEFPITAFRGVRDRKVTAEMVARGRWADGGNGICVGVGGGRALGSNRTRKTVVTRRRSTNRTEHRRRVTRRRMRTRRRIRRGETRRRRDEIARIGIGYSCVNTRKILLRGPRCLSFPSRVRALRGGCFLRRRFLRLCRRHRRVNLRSLARLQTTPDR